MFGYLETGPKRRCGKCLAGPRSSGRRLVHQPRLGDRGRYLRGIARRLAGNCQLAGNGTLRSPRAVLPIQQGFIHSHSDPSFARRFPVAWRPGIAMALLAGGLGLPALGCSPPA